MSNTKKGKSTFIKFISAIALVFCFIFLASCSTSFCTPQDNANKLYATYGNIYALDVDETDSSVLSSDNIERALQEQKNNRNTIYAYLTQGAQLDRNNKGYEFPLPNKQFYSFMNKKVDSFVETNYKLWTNSTIDKLSDTEAKKICLHVAVYAGVEQNVVAPLFTNMDKWYNDAIRELGYDVVPTSSFMTALQRALTLSANSSTACISPSSKEYEMGNKLIYVEGKTWGDAFREYGFFSGLFVWPFAALVHVISQGLNNTGWAQVFAIFVVTILVRSISIYSIISQNKSQERSKIIQPELEALKKKYPNMNEDRQQKQAYALEQMQLMRKAKTHPFRPMLFTLLQLPLFFFLWSALQGSAALASGRWLGISLTTTVQECFSNYANTPGALTGIIFFFITCAMSIAGNLTSMSFNKWKQDKGYIANQQVAGNSTPGALGAGGMTKMMSLIFIAFYVIMAYRLPVGMNIYFYIGSVLTVIQSVVMELINSIKRRKNRSNTGDGSDLASLRRSSKHRYDDNKKKGNSAKPLWR